MTRLSQQTIHRYFQLGISAATTIDRGRALEDMICYIFSRVPGITISRRNRLNAFSTEEVDVAFWNEKSVRGLYFLPHIILVECKNWSNPVGSTEVAYLSKRLENRGADHGVLVAVNGITGDSQQLTGAHYELAMALSRGIYILVITRDEIESLTHSGTLVNLLKEKLCDLAIMGTVSSPSSSR